MIEDLHETTKKIKQSLRLSMNGIVSAHQRNSGLNYKINFGVEIPRIKEIAADYIPSKELAVALWQENIRECKLLAIFLLPREEYSTMAEFWIAETTFTEIADHLTKTILCTLPTATTSAIEWIGNEKGLFRYCGYLTLAHLIRQGTTLNPEEETTYFSHASELFKTGDNALLRRIALSSLLDYIYDSDKRATHLLGIAGENSQLGVMIKEGLSF